MPQDKAAEACRVQKKSYPTSPEAMSSIDNDIGNGEQKPFTTTAGARHGEKKLFSCSTRSVRSVFHNFDFPQRWRETFIVRMKMCFPQLLLKLNRFSPPSAHTVYVTTKHNVFIEALKSGAISEAILSFFGWRLLDCFSHNLPAPSAPYHVGEPLKPFWCKITINWCDDKRLDLCNYSWRHDVTQRDILKCSDNDIKDFPLDFFSFQIRHQRTKRGGRVKWLSRSLGENSIYVRDGKHVQLSIDWVSLLHGPDDVNSRNNFLTESSVK